MLKHSTIFQLFERYRLDFEMFDYSLEGYLPSDEVEQYNNATHEWSNIEPLLGKDGYYKDYNDDYDDEFQDDDSSLNYISSNSTFPNFDITSEQFNKDTIKAITKKKSDTHVDAVDHNFKERM